MVEFVRYRGRSIFHIATFESIGTPRQLWTFAQRRPSDAYPICGFGDGVQMEHVDGSRGRLCKICEMLVVEAEVNVDEFFRALFGEPERSDFPAIVWEAERLGLPCIHRELRDRLRGVLSAAD